MAELFFSPQNMEIVQTEFLWFCEVACINKSMAGAPAEQRNENRVSPVFVYQREPARKACSSATGSSAIQSAPRQRTWARRCCRVVATHDRTE